MPPLDHRAFLILTETTCQRSRSLVVKADRPVRKMLYPPPYDSESSSKPLPNSYEPFRILDERIEESLRSMAEEERIRMEESEGQGLNGMSCVPEPPTLALCHMARESLTVMVC